MATQRRKAAPKQAPQRRAQRAPARAKSLPERLPVTRARQELCPLVKELSRREDGVVAVMVGEEVGAYLVSPEKMEQLEEAHRRMLLAPRPTLRGDTELIGDVDEALAAARRLMQEDLDRRWDRMEARINDPDAE